MSEGCRVIDPHEPLAVEFRFGLPPEAAASIQTVTARHKTLEDVVRWGLMQKPPRLIADVVRMDEFNQDVVIEYAPGIWLVYDTT